jgi:formate dehydrogenase
MAKIIVVLYDDPVDGYPKTYARDTIPEIKSYPGGQTAPTPQGIDFKQASCSAASPARSGSRNGPPTTAISL